MTSQQDLALQALATQPCDVTVEQQLAPSKDPRALSLRTNFSWTFAGNVVYAGCQWGMLAVLAKLGSPEIVGQFALGLAVTAPVIMLSNLQLRGVLATDANEDHHFSEYLVLRVMTTAVALLAVGGIVALTGYRRQTSLVILAVALAKGFESISDIAYGSMQRQERMDRVSHSLMLRGAVAIAALWAGVYFTGSVFLGSLGMAVGWGLVLVIVDLPGVARADSHSWTIRSILHGRSGLEWQRIVRLAILTAPLGVVMMLLSLNVNLPRYVIQHDLGERSLGIFASVAYLMVAGSTVVGALGQSASPRLARHYASGDVAGFWILMRRLVALGAALGAAGILVAVAAGRPILRVLFESDYADSADVLAWVMTAAAISYAGSFLGYGLTAARRFKVQAPIIGVVTVVTAAASIVLIPRHGLIGAAWAMALGSVVQLIGTGFFLIRATRATPKPGFAAEASAGTRQP